MKKTISRQKNGGKKRSKTKSHILIAVANLDCKKGNIANK